MHYIDVAIFIAYFLLMLGVGFYFLKQNQSNDDYFVGGRNIGSTHIGLSVVATDVGGGFSIGLGGLGFMIGISGSWMLLTGLIGAWLSAIFLIPKVYEISKLASFSTFPQIVKYFYSREVALIAGIISAIGYLGFTSSQILAGAKLATATFDVLNLQTALIIMGVIAVIYTVMGGLKAVIYTDTIQWIILMGGLIFIGIPAAYYAIGGYETIVNTVPKNFLSFSNLSWQDMVNWSITIIPIWFIGMTLYQRIFASKNKKEAQKAWFIAGLLEWPIMALMGVLLGLFSRIAAMNGMFVTDGFADVNMLDPEMGIPLLLKNVLPVGLLGLMMSAYFSAIMSTADSCLMAASGNIVTDIIESIFRFTIDKKKLLRFSQIVTLIAGGFAIIIAIEMTNVLELMLYSYAFMVSGLLVPIVAALIRGKGSPVAAFWAMVSGGGTTLSLIISGNRLPYDLDANVFGISISAMVFTVLSILLPSNYQNNSVKATTNGL